MTGHLFDPDEGTRRRDAAIATAQDHAPKDWKDNAELAVLLQVGEFTTDDVWAWLDAWQIPAPHEPRALGAVMRSLAKAGKIVNTGEWVKSVRAEAHRRPVAVWRKA